jgi:sigma-E factor negative regulatory protein RseA
MKTLESDVNTLSNLEKLSALRDGQLGAADALALVRASLADERLVHEWRSICVVGDVLRAEQSQISAAMLSNATPNSALSQPALQPVMHAAPAEAANDGVFRWKMVAGVAAFAAVGSLVWGLMGKTSPDLQGGAVLASAPAQQASPAQAQQGSVQTVNATAVPNSPGLVAVQASPEAPVMIRDPRLDELLAAHKQFGGVSALQQPAGSLRSASLSTPRQ